MFRADDKCAKSWIIYVYSTNIWRLVVNSQQLTKNLKQLIYIFRGIFKILDSLILYFLYHMYF